MRKQAKLLAILTAAALSTGCASSGGSGGGGEMVVDTAEEQFLCMFVPLFCLFGNDVGSPAASATTAVAPRVPAFTSWSELGPLEKAEFQALSSTVKYTESAPGQAGSVSAATPPQAEVVVRSHDAAAAVAQGWSYQSFGIWDRHVSGGGTLGATSFGAVTPASAVPSSGSATFSGRLGGLYISPTGQGSVASAQLSVNADFSSRTLSFASSGTTLTRDHGIGTAAPHLNLAGTLAYSPSTNTFGGALSSAGGTMSGSSSGRYYGPAAQELGGVFTVKSATTVETLTGAYGAKR